MMNSSAPITTQKILQALEHLLHIVAQLRAPEGGCPWDLAQTQQSLTPYIIEEAYEVVHAIQSGEQTAIAEELGDLLLQVVLQAQVAQDEGHFNLETVAQGIADKLIRRHPHVFGELEVESVEAVRQNWEKIKAAEKGFVTVQGGIQTLEAIRLDDFGIENAGF
jgi:XTP/dITP diphosphohydrolase